LSADLEILLTRFRWPVATTRWWAMQELAVLLVSEDLREPVSKRLLIELSRCRLEAEVVEVITIFWMAAKSGYIPPPDLASTLRYPSLPAALLLNDLGLGSDGMPNPPLVTVYRDFKAPAKFQEIQGTEVPRYLLSRLARLERDFGRPFVSQCGLEWAMTEAAYPEAPLQGDIDHFVRPFGEGFIGAFASRAMLRMLTAYQRTLEVARTIWGFPDDVARYFAEDALPLDPTLAFLRPDRPSWLPNLTEVATGDEASIEDSVNRMLSALSAAQPEAILLALESPIYVDSQTITELSLVRWRQWKSLPVDATKLAGRFYRRQERMEYGVFQASKWGLETILPPTTLDTVLDHETGAAPMAAVYGFNRIGYLQRDLYPSRFYYPVKTEGNEALSVKPAGAKLEVSTATESIATACYWNAGWGAVHPSGMSGLYGTALVATGNLQAQTEAPPDGHFYLWKVTRLRRSNDYGPFSADEPLYGIVVR
jgi:hypothetical protein